MLDESAVDTARRQLSAVMDDRTTALAADTVRIVNSAVVRGMINAPATHQEIAGVIYQEYRVRATLCADAFLALVGEGDLSEAVAVGEQLKSLTAETLDLSVDDLTGMYGGFATLAGAVEILVPLEQCRADAMAEAEARIDAALQGSGAAS